MNFLITMMFQCHIQTIYWRKQNRILKYFESAVKNLGVSEEINTRTDFESSDPVDIAPLKYKYHPSVLKFKEFIGENISEFHFSETAIENVENEIEKLNVSLKRYL